MATSQRKSVSESLQFDLYVNRLLDRLNNDPVGFAPNSQGPSTMLKLMKAAFGRQSANRVRSIARDENGNAGIEYGLIAALVSVVIISGLQLVGNNVSGVLHKIGSALPVFTP